MKEFHDYLMQVCYTGKGIEQIRQKSASLANQLRNDNQGTLILGHRVSYIDFNLFEIFQLMDFLTNGSILKFYPEMQQHINAMVDQEGLRQFFKSKPKCITELPFNHRFAQVNNWPKVVYREMKSALDDDVEIIQQPAQKYYKIQEYDEMVVIDMKGV